MFGTLKLPYWRSCHRLISNIPISFAHPNLFLSGVYREVQAVKLGMGPEFKSLEAWYPPTLYGRPTGKAFDRESSAWKMNKVLGTRLVGKNLKVVSTVTISER